MRFHSLALLSFLSLSSTTTVSGFHNQHSIALRLPLQQLVEKTPAKTVTLKATTIEDETTTQTIIADNDVLVDDEDDEDAGVDFPPPLSSIQRVKRAIEFYKRALPVLGAYKLKEVEFLLKDKIPLLESVDEDSQEEIWNEIDEWGSTQIAETISEMKGFYVKTGQVISTRVDLFPEAYTSKLQSLQDGLDPMPFELVEKVVSQELLDGAPLSELFKEFDEEPLGSASIAQVHRATLLDGRVVAVKLQRPNVEPKLRGDIANLKRISKALRDQLPVDYYTVFTELGMCVCVFMCVLHLPCFFYCLIKPVFLGY